jgi:acyl dehydratase
VELCIAATPVGLRPLERGLIAALALDSRHFGFVRMGSVLGMVLIRLHQPRGTLWTMTEQTELTEFPVPHADRHFEDYQAGAVYQFAETVSTTEAEIIEFATKYDPQTIHTDPVYAANGPYHGLIASGWHTGGMMMRLLARHYLPDSASLGSPGIDELRWVRPVRPDEQLRLRVTTVSARPSKSKPDRGLVRTKAELLNEDGEVVFHLTALNFIRRRSVEA